MEKTMSNIIDLQQFKRLQLKSKFKEAAMADKNDTNTHVPLRQVVDECWQCGVQMQTDQPYIDVHYMKNFLDHNHEKVLHRMCIPCARTILPCVCDDNINA